MTLPSPTPAEPTASLLARTYGGDAQAFDAVFAPRCATGCAGSLTCDSASTCGAAWRVDDILQETYAAALRLLPGFESQDEGAFIRWLFALAENQIRRLAAHHGADHRVATEGRPPRRRRPSH